ncbi:hypothetical protein [Streptomyces sp. NPDC001135]
MNVLVCAARGRRLSPPPRPLPELPERPERDGRDRARQAPSAVPRGMYAVGPEPSVPGCGVTAAARPDACTGPGETPFPPGAVRTVPA